MRLAGIRTLEEANKLEANKFLKGYLQKHNRKFGVKPCLEENRRQENQVDIAHKYAYPFSVRI
ncbi:MAG: hypothetical protein P0S93_02070 [Candidatus Neptunochlamydia sp.]|nr:hypothetical protein [Candidatus Neptunochlamydia sp.]